MKGITGNPALDAYHRMAISPVGNARPAERGETSSTNSGASPAAAVTISAHARDLAQTTQSVDSQKVEGLRQSIQNGSYRSDPHVIASKMMEQLG